MGEQPIVRVRCVRSIKARLNETHNRFQSDSRGASEANDPAFKCSAREQSLHGAQAHAELRGDIAECQQPCRGKFATIGRSLRRLRHRCIKATGFCLDQPGPVGTCSTADRRSSECARGSCARVRRERAPRRLVRDGLGRYPLGESGLPDGVPRARRQRCFSKRVRPAFDGPARSSPSACFRARGTRSAPRSSCARAAVVGAQTPRQPEGQEHPFGGALRGNRSALRAGQAVR